MSLKIQKYLMEKAGYSLSSNDPRKLITTFSRGYYGQVSSCLIEVEGSPVRGRALIFGSASFHQISGQEWKVVIQQKENKFKTLIWFGYDGKATIKSGIAEKLVRHAFHVLLLEKEGV